LHGFKQLKGKNMKIELLIIDPQNDFCHQNGTLFVPGATEDMANVADMIVRLKEKIDDIHITLDSHHRVDVAHPIFWLDSSGKHPDPFTIITAEDVKNGLFRTTNPQFQARATEYVQDLENNGRYPLCIWPYHCLIGSWGYGVINEGTGLYDALEQWEMQFANVDFVTKGSNLWTEHYSAVQADVPDAQDPSTQLNMPLIETLQKADIILLAGEARSHCLANTVIDIANNFGEENIKKMVLLTDATSDVPDPPGTTMFSDIGNAFVKDMKARGMQTSTTVDFLA
jgi:nicotinamidase-related amidase